LCKEIVVEDSIIMETSYIGRLGVGNVWKKCQLKEDRRVVLEVLEKSSFSRLDLSLLLFQKQLFPIMNLFVKVGLD
jgi:hypothetical protein